ncbi:MAG: TIGR03118 family protein, partial [Kineosporiaceae bacterium]
ELLVADFAHGLIVAFDGSFHRMPLPAWAFRDGSIPKGYAPFNVAVLGQQVFVTYALRNPTTNDDVKGAGHGFVDVYSASGRLLDRFARRGVLNSPWGLAIAPARFGAFSGDVLVGNFGDGRIHAFDPRTGQLLETLRDGHGHPIVIDGLWGLLPGNGTSAGTNDVWFSAGPQDESHGLLGVLRALHEK